MLLLLYQRPPLKAYLWCTSKLQSAPPLHCFVLLCCDTMLAIEFPDSVGNLVAMAPTILQSPEEKDKQKKRKLA